MNKTGFAFIFFLFMASMISCKKDPPVERKIYYMDSEFRDYSIFKTGSWWVYQKDTLTPIDSVYVIASDFNLIAPDSVDYSWQRSLVQYKSSRDGDTVSSAGDFVKSTSTFYSKRKSTLTTLAEQLDFFSLKPTGFVLDLSSSLKMKYREVKDTSINGILFNGVKMFENLSPSSAQKSIKEFWYAKNVGIIRKQLFNGEVWNLIKYEVVQ